MKILILDDDPERHAYFANLYAQHYVTHAYGATEAICVHISGPVAQRFDLVHLDYDLPLSRQGEYIEDFHSGMAVARELVKNAHRYRPYIEVHSWNAKGGRRMADALRDAGFSVKHRPWGWREDAEFALWRLGKSYPELDAEQLREMLR